jgi:hypothetical protein
MFLEDILEGKFGNVLRMRHVAAFARATLKAFYSISSKYRATIGPADVGFNDGFEEATLCTWLSMIPLVGRRPSGFSRSHRPYLVHAQMTLSIGKNMV